MWPPGCRPQLATTRSECVQRRPSPSCAAPAPSRLSGKTNLHRLNRGGDRRASNALFTIVLVRLRHDPATRADVPRRAAEGKSRKEIMRRMKRFVAREVFGALTNPPADVPTGHELRQLRLQLGLSLATVCNAVETTPTRLSNIERCRAHDTCRARLARSWLTEKAG